MKFIYFAMTQEAYPTIQITEVADYIMECIFLKTKQVGINERAKP